MKVFYSWQSDLPNSTNRSLIERALRAAANGIASDESIEVEPVVDRDTFGVPGAPNIAQAILRKIDQCDAFVADVSIIGRAGDRPTPNPNVLVELGYALSKLGWERLILVQNTAYGPPEELPFDLRMARTVTYSVNQDDELKAPARKQLEGVFDTALRTIIQWRQDNPVDGPPGAETDVVDRVAAALADQGHPAALARLLEDLRNRVIGALEAENLLDVGGSLDREVYVGRVTGFESSVLPVLPAFREAGSWASESQFRPFTRCLEFWMDRPVSNPYSPELVNLGRYPVTLALYASGIAALVERNWPVLRALLHDLKVPVPHQDPDPALEALHPVAVLGHDRSKWLPDMERRYVAWSDRVCEVLQPVFNAMLPTESAWEREFDRFEYFFALAFVERRAQVSDRVGSRSTWAPLGSFTWRTKTTVVQAVREELELEGDSWGPVQAGFFRSDAARLLELAASLEEFLARVRQSKGIFR